MNFMCREPYHSQQLFTTFSYPLSKFKTKRAIIKNNMNVCFTVKPIMLNTITVESLDNSTQMAIINLFK